MPEEDPHPALSKTKFARSKRLREVCDRAERVHWPFPYHGLSPVRLNRCSGRTSVEPRFSTLPSRMNDATMRPRQAKKEGFTTTVKMPELRKLGSSGSLPTSSLGALANGLSLISLPERRRSSRP